MPNIAIRRVFYLLLTMSSLANAQVKALPEGPEILNMAPVPSDRFPAKWYPQASSEIKVGLAPVVDKPYTAITETVDISKSESGEPSRRITLGFQARDRFGRERIEFLNGFWGVDEQRVPTKTVSVSDPVSHCTFEWTELVTNVPVSTEWKSAFVTCFPQALFYKEFHLIKLLPDPSDDVTSTYGDKTTKTEHLAPLQVDGVKVDRLLVSNTWTDDKGLAKKRSTETWYSLDLQEIIRTGDEESGYEGLKEIRLVDPDPKLFYPPVGYRIEVRPAR
jgi:hypothetical protein